MDLTCMNRQDIDGLINALQLAKASIGISDGAIDLTGPSIVDLGNPDCLRLPLFDLRGRVVESVPGADVADLIARTLSPSPDAAPSANGEVVLSATPVPDEAAGEVGTKRLPSAPNPVAKPALPSTNRNGLPWEQWEDDAIIAGRKASKTWGAIAALIGRTYDATAFRGVTLKSRITATPSTNVVAPVVIAEAVKPAPAVEPLLDTPAPIAEVDPAAPVWKRAIHTHLNGLGYAAPWTAALDAAMLIGLGAGRSLADFSEQHDLPLIDVKARFFALREPVPERGAMTIEAQKRLTETLKERALAPVAA